MPRPRKNDPSSTLGPIIEEFATRLAHAVEQFTVRRIESAVKAQGGGKRAGRAAARGGKRSATLCYYPGCKNIAAPRFGMFCAADHKNLSKAEKEKYRAMHAKAAAKPAKGAPKKRGRKGSRR